MRGSTLAFAMLAAVLCMMASEVAACQSSCKTCWRANKCKICKDGWYRDGSWRCQRCTSKLAGCSKCKLQNGKPYCTKCQTGYSWINGRCKKVSTPVHCRSPFWDTNAVQWRDVWYKAHSGKCQKCTPTGNHWGWCKACESSNPSWCKVCEDGSANRFPMYIDGNKECQFCTAVFGDSCTACKWDHTQKAPFCTKCKTSWVSDGMGGCIPGRNVEPL